MNMLEWFRQNKPPNHYRHRLRWWWYTRRPDWFQKKRRCIARLKSVYAHDLVDEYVEESEHAEYRPFEDWFNYEGSWPWLIDYARLTTDFIQWVANQYPGLAHSTLLQHPL